MAAIVTYQQYSEQYLAELRSAGVGSDDAQCAVQLAWTIGATHQACYGISSTVPVHFFADSMPRNEHVVASCGARRFQSENYYAVYARNLWRHFQALEAALAGQVEIPILIAGVAVHEVRHRVQDREANSVRLFCRKGLAGDWYDEQAALVAVNMNLQFTEWESRDAQSGVSEEDRRWLYSDDEFDAAIVERLMLHRSSLISTDAQLAALVRMDCPKVVL